MDICLFEIFYITFLFENTQDLSWIKNMTKPQFNKILMYNKYKIEHVGSFKIGCLFYNDHGRSSAKKEKNCKILIQITSRK